MLILRLVLFVAGFVLLVKGADFLVGGASSIARELRVSELVIGLTVVAFGTSVPELVVNVSASVSGVTDIAIGNILGSSTANILLILGIAAVIYPISVTRTTVWREIPLAVLAAVLVAVVANDIFLDGSLLSFISRTDGIVLMLFFVIFVYYVLALIRGQRARAQGKAPQKRGLLRPIVLVVIGAIGVNIGARFVVDSAVFLADHLQVSQSLIALTAVAIGTSLPELVTAVTAAAKKNTDMAVGTVVGSNVFNVFCILGLSAIIRPIPLPLQANMDILVLLGASVLLFLAMFTGGKKHFLTAREGFVFVGLYVAYIVVLLLRR